MARTTHGVGKHPLYKTWHSMIHRCHNQNHRAYKLYGNRGIYVCDSWHDPRIFISDMFPSWRKGLSLDRINNDGPYSQANCRWASMETQSNNRTTSHILSNNGKAMTISEWSAETNLSENCIRKRIYRGWAPARALSTISNGNKGKPASDVFQFRGIIDSLNNHARRADLKPNTVWRRIKKRGWSVERALTTPGHAA